MLITQEKDLIIHFHISEVEAVAKRLLHDTCNVVGLGGGLFRASLEGEGFACAAEELLTLADWWIDDWNVTDEGTPAGTMRYPLIAQLAKRYQKPICILDLETTGFCKCPVRGIVDFAYIRIEPDGTFSEFSTLLDPGIPIDPRASDVHGIYEKDVDGKPKFDGLMPLLKALYSECVISGYNSRSFDISVLAENFDYYAGAFIKPEYQLDVRNIWQGKNRGSTGKLVDIANFFKVTTGTAHRAQGDVLTTTNLLEAMIAEYGIDYIIDNGFLYKNEARVYISEQKAKKTQSVQNSVAYKEVELSNKPTITLEQKAREAVLAHLSKKKSKLMPEDYAAFARKTDVHEDNISFAVQRLIVSGEIDVKQVTDKKAQKELKPVVAAIKKEHDTRMGLRYIKTVIERKLKICVNYNQLLIALRAA